MQPKQTSSTDTLHLFQSSFKQILNLEHSLCRLADQVDWSQFDQAFAECYSPEIGRPGNAIRLMVGLHYLKYTFDESDESVVDRWVENPYWQYFCGYEYLQHECPIHPTSLVKWRQRVGVERLESLLQETIRIAVQTKQVSSQQLRKITVDTTVQEKAIAFPTDARLYTKMILRLANLAKRRSLPLRQSYVRVAPQLLKQQNRYAHARQFKRAAGCTRKLKHRLGRLVRDIQRKTESFDCELNLFLERAKRLLQQTRDSQGKLYSIDAPEVECISKGKAHKRYEFGCKVSVATTNQHDWIVGVQALHGNPYDGHTLAGAVKQVEHITRRAVTAIFLDKGYRGHDYAGTAEVHITGQRSRRPASRSLRRRKKRRSAIEPKIGHLKSDNRMDRNYLKGSEGDRINALLAGIGANMRKLLAAFWRALREISCFIDRIERLLCMRARALYL
ncbi:IS5 family transposase [Planctomycetota bacterium]